MSQATYAPAAHRDALFGIGQCPPMLAQDRRDLWTAFRLRNRHEVPGKVHDVLDFGYTPRARRRFGYWALPMLSGEQVVGWANLSWQAGQLEGTFGYAAGHPPRARSFACELEAELVRMPTFLAHACDDDPR